MSVSAFSPGRMMTLVQQLHRETFEVLSDLLAGAGLEPGDQAAFEAAYRARLAAAGAAYQAQVAEQAETLLGAEAAGGRGQSLAEAVQRARQVLAALDAGALSPLQVYLVYDRMVRETLDLALQVLVEEYGWDERAVQRFITAFWARLAEEVEG